jgi:hypothetical protein
LYVYNKIKNTIRAIQETGKGKEVFCYPQTAGKPIAYTDGSKAEVT